MTHFLYRMPARWKLILTLAIAHAGCEPPRLVARMPSVVSFAGQGPTVRLQVEDTRAKREYLGIGYVGIFQEKVKLRVSEKTPPSAVVEAALQSDLAERGMRLMGDGYAVTCQMPQLLLRYRNYAGSFSATDGWGYLDLDCEVKSARAAAWRGMIHARYHKAFYQPSAEELCGDLLGELVQQAVAILN